MKKEHKQQEFSFLVIREQYVLEVNFSYGAQSLLPPGIYIRGKVGMVRIIQPDQVNKLRSGVCMKVLIEYAICSRKIYHSSKYFEMNPGYRIKRKNPGKSLSIGPTGMVGEQEGLT
jgi:hypothetical protein